MHGSTQLKASELAKSSEKGATELSESSGVDGSYAYYTITKYSSFTSTIALQVKLKAMILIKIDFFIYSFFVNLIYPTIEFFI